jgi:hypothetical protein
MKRTILHWTLMIAAAGLVYFAFRYWCGDYQGYLTLHIGHSEIGFAHIKSLTEWVADKQLTPLPDILSLAMLLGSLALLGYEVPKVYKSSVHKNDVA